MQVSVAGLRRNIKNIAHNYTEPQKKVREATSNDPWGPSSTLMSEIADLTYNIEAFSQIMEMLWKRLNDHGKNWRHVYKSLVLLEYLIKTGSERVAQQCKENIFAIQTLKDFQYFEDNKDQGLNVREKAKQLVVLLSSEERLRNERARALKARERFAQTVSGFGSSDSNDTTPTSPVFSSHQFSNGAETNGVTVHDGQGYTRRRNNSELEQARPQTVGEEELQLQLALAMSKEEADQEEKRRRSDDLRLQMALSQSEQEFQSGSPEPTRSTKKNNGSALVDLLDVDLGGAAALPQGAAAISPGAVGGVADPWAPVQRAAAADPWSGSSSTVTSPQDPWNSSNIGGATGGGGSSGGADPWITPGKTPPVVKADPWASGGSNSGPSTSTPNYGGLDEDEFDTISKRTEPNKSVFGMEPIGHALLTPMNLNSHSNNSSPTPLGSTNALKRNNPMEFLGENSGLVNLDNLVPSNNSATTTPILGLGSNSNLSMGLQQNPFAAPTAVGPSLLTTGTAQTVNPFHLQNAVAKPSINEIREKQQQLQIQGLTQGNSTPSTAAAAAAQNNPWSPVKTENPFMN